MSERSSNKSKSAIELHVAGATVRHPSPFSTLKVPENKDSLEREFIDRYISPFYMEKKCTAKYREAFLNIKEEVDDKLILTLLGDFNWRSRKVGADFCAIGGRMQFEEHIGNLLLRSDVCYSGHHYCLALAKFGTDSAIGYLDRYLDYYLKQPDLWFDQGSALAALFHLEKSKNSNLTDSHMSDWERFVRNKESWNLKKIIVRFNDEMAALSNLKIV